MAYLKDFRKSKLLDDPFICELLEDILKLEPGESAVRIFGEKADAKRKQYNVYQLLNGHKSKKYYLVSLRYDGKLFWNLNVTRTAGGKSKVAVYKG